jgi:ABC-type cobalt transport system substrate-binding protein
LLALILGVDQWFSERWQVDSAEIEKWVSIAVFMGALMGAIAGALIGLVVGFARSRRLPN